MSAPSVARLPAPDVRALAERGVPLVWPIGSTEQHGPHLVTGFDLASVEAVCARAAAELAPDVALLPGLPYGSSDHWLPLGATFSLRPETLAAVVSDVVRSAADAGFGRLVIVNGHAGNIGPALTAIGSTRTRPVVELVSYWQLVEPAELVSACRVDDGGIGHAGEVETSIALYLGEGLAVAERVPDAAGAPLGSSVPGSRSTTFLRAPRPLDEAQSGVYGDPRAARAELGELVVERAARQLSVHLRALVDRGGPGA